MEVYRIAKCGFIRDLSGTGARLYGGRWNSKGLYPVIYTAGSRSLAALEAVVHVPPGNLTDDFCLAVIHIPDSLSIKEISLKSLPENWQKNISLPGLQQLGDSWCASKRVPLLKVPSAIIPEEWNYLINPQHPDAPKVRISKVVPFLFDKRLL